MHLAFHKTDFVSEYVPQLSMRSKVTISNTLPAMLHLLHMLQMKKCLCYESIVAMELQGKIWHSQRTFIANQHIVLSAKRTGTQSR